MNYRHAFHAGNFADVHKHLTLLGVLRKLQQKPAPLAILDTHAGAGVYDLSASPAQRSGEWKDGIGRLQEAHEAPDLVRHYLQSIAALQLAADEWRIYPGSPRLIAQHLRGNDRLHLCELETTTLEELRQAMRHTPQASIHARDGWEALGALLPPRGFTRGMVLIDPPYEAANELDRLTQAMQQTHARWPQGALLGWYPIKDRPPIDRMLRVVQQAALPNVLVSELNIYPTDNPLQLNGSGMIVINAPWQLDEELREVNAWLHPRLARHAAATWRVIKLT